MNTTTAQTTSTSGSEVDEAPSAPFWNHVAVHDAFLQNSGNTFSLTAMEAIEGTKGFPITWKYRQHKVCVLNVKWVGTSTLTFDKKGEPSYLTPAHLYGLTNYLGQLWAFEAKNTRTPPKESVTMIRFHHVPTGIAGKWTDTELEAFQHAYKKAKGRSLPPGTHGLGIVGLDGQGMRAILVASNPKYMKKHEPRLLPFAEDLVNVCIGDVTLIKKEPVVKPELVIQVNGPLPVDREGRVKRAIPVQKEDDGIPVAPFWNHVKIHEAFGNVFHEAFDMKSSPRTYVSAQRASEMLMFEGLPITVKIGYHKVCVFKAVFVNFDDDSVPSYCNGLTSFLGTVWAFEYDDDNYRFIHLASGIQGKWHTDEHKALCDAYMRVCGKEPLCTRVDIVGLRDPQFRTIFAAHVDRKYDDADRHLWLYMDDVTPLATTVTTTTTTATVQPVKPHQEVVPFWNHVKIHDAFTKKSTTATLEVTAKRASEMLMLEGQPITVGVYNHKVCVLKAVFDESPDKPLLHYITPTRWCGLTDYMGEVWAFECVRPNVRFIHIATGRVGNWCTNEHDAMEDVYEQVHEAPLVSGGSDILGLHSSLLRWIFVACVKKESLVKDMIKWNYCTVQLYENVVTTLIPPPDTTSATVKRPRLDSPSSPTTMTSRTVPDTEEGTIVGPMPTTTATTNQDWPRVMQHQTDWMMMHHDLSNILMHGLIQPITTTTTTTTTDDEEDPVTCLVRARASEIGVVLKRHFSALNQLKKRG